MVHLLRSMIYSTLWFNTKLLFSKRIKSKSQQTPFFSSFLLSEREREKLNEETNHSKQEADVKPGCCLGSCSACCKGIV